MDCDYLITPFCFYKAWNTYLKSGFGYVWIQYLIDFVEISDDFTNADADLEPFSFISGTFWMLAWNLLDFISGTSWFYFCKPLSWMTDDFLFAQHVGLNSPDFIFAFWGSVAWVPLISFYFSGVQPHLGAPQGDNQGCLRWLNIDVWKAGWFQGHPERSRSPKQVLEGRKWRNGYQQFLLQILSTSQLSWYYLADLLDISVTWCPCQGLEKPIILLLCIQHTDISKKYYIHTCKYSIQVCI